MEGPGGVVPVDSKSSFNGLWEFNWNWSCWFNRCWWWGGLWGSSFDRKVKLWILLSLVLTVRRLLGQYIGYARNNTGLNCVWEGFSARNSWNWCGPPRACAARTGNNPFDPGTAPLTDASWNDPEEAGSIEVVVPLGLLPPSTAYANNSIETGAYGNHYAWNAGAGEIMMRLLLLLLVQLMLIILLPGVTLGIRLLQMLQGMRKPVKLLMLEILILVLWLILEMPLQLLLVQMMRLVKLVLLLVGITLQLLLPLLGMLGLVLLVKLVLLGCWFCYFELDGWFNWWWRGREAAFARNDALCTHYTPIIHTLW